MDTLAQVSEINAHTGLIKALAKSDGIIFSSSGNVIKLWDTVSLQNNYSFTVPIEEIKVLQISNNFLYGAGKGTEGGNSLYVWDLRKSKTPIFESEESQDIQTLQAFEGFCYYPRKKNIIKSLLNENVQVLEPCYKNTITGIIKYNNTIVSSSKDRSIKQWDNNGNFLCDINNAHTDWITCLEPDLDNNHVFSGGKEGKIKVWRGETLKQIGELLGLNSSIHCLASIPNNILISAASDKTFKLWKLQEDVEWLYLSNKTKNTIYLYLQRASLFLLQSFC